MDFKEYSSSQLERFLAKKTVASELREQAQKVLDARNGVEQKAAEQSPAKDGELTPTKEQIAAINAFESGGRVIISAYAGAGKTSTLQLIAESTTRRGLYLAFNNATAVEAAERFPENMTCRTTHSQALTTVKNQFPNAKLFTSLTPRSLKSLHDLKSSIIAGKEIDGLGFAFLLLLTVRSFCHSADTEILLDHVPEDKGQLKKYEGLALRRAQQHIFKESVNLWKRMLDPSDLTPLGHDGYLKLWSLGCPILDFDFILLDEAQDTNPCVMKVLSEQSCQVIYVGDPYQQIYEWRGAVNAMASVKAEKEARLSTTFRFGPELAEVATELLSNLNEKAPLTALATKSTRLVSEGEADVKIARKNATLIEQCLRHQEDGDRVAFVGVREDLQKLISSVYELKAERPAKHTDLAGFANWEEVVAHAQLDEGADLVAIVSLVQKFGEGRLYGALKEAVDEASNPDIVLTSGHRSKGREWNKVEVCDDFGDLIDAKGRISYSGGRLFYVAITRAKTKLIVQPTLLDAFCKSERFYPDDELEAIQQAEAEELALETLRDNHTAPEDPHFSG